MLARDAIGHVVHDLRDRRGLTLRQVSARGNIALGYISEVERGQKEPSSEIVERLALALDTSPGEIMIEAGRLMLGHELSWRFVGELELTRT